VANGTSAEITGLDTRQRTMTVRTLEDLAAKTVTLPAWYLDGVVRPGQSRRVDLAYARTDMRSQGRTEQRALLALDGEEDMQGFYVQVTRSIERTDLYLTVGPEPLGPEEAHPHPRGERLEPEQLRSRVMTRDGAKTIAADIPAWWMCAACPPGSSARSAMSWPRCGPAAHPTAPGSCSGPGSAPPSWRLPARPARPNTKRLLVPWLPPAGGCCTGGTRRPPGIGSPSPSMHSRR
jgi:hypothetical protein